MSAGEPTIRLLLVDDERDFLEAVAQGLERRGVEVRTAEEGATALAILRDHDIDVVVLDVKMPGMDGISVFARIAEMAPRVPVIMLTGHGNIQDAFETSRRGVYEYLTKPCRVDTLADTVRKAHRDRVLADERARLEEIERAARILAERPD